MPAKKKLPTIFKDGEELKRFLIASVADCASIGHLTDLSEDDKTQLLDIALGRMQVAMCDYHAHLHNGNIEAMDEGMTDEWRQEFRDRSLEFVEKVFNENEVEIDGKDE